jgi:hypothetical protein
MAMKSKWMVTGLLAAIGFMMAPTTSQAGLSIRISLAAQRYGHGDGRYAYGVGQDRGYHEGLKCGRDDARHDRHFAPERHGRYRDCDHGYNRRFGPRGAYANGYRDGFERGYREAFGQWGPRHGRDRGDWGRDRRDRDRDGGNWDRDRNW